MRQYLCCESSCRVHCSRGTDCIAGDAFAGGDGQVLSSDGNAGPYHSASDLREQLVHCSADGSDAELVLQALDNISPVMKKSQSSNASCKVYESRLQKGRPLA